MKGQGEAEREKESQADADWKEVRGFMDPNPQLRGVPLGKYAPKVYALFTPDSLNVYIIYIIIEGHLCVYWPL